MTRCFGNGPDQQLYAQYHDHEWGVPSHDDIHLFELLILEGAQAGLSWEIVLKKREGYRKAFYQFDPQKVAVMKDEELEALRLDPSIIRNRLKIYAARQNAKVFLMIQKEFGSFDHYVWSFVSNKPITNHPKTLQEMQSSSEISDQISKDLKKRGMTFVGSTIIY
jgi:DNA-3-methyladenine glycosylase I